jgi:hypothetical protein
MNQGSEAEGGTVDLGANIVNDPSASEGKAVMFGTVGNKPTTPSAIKVFAGGDSIAFHWGGSVSGSGPIKEYRIFRDGVQIDKVTPGHHVGFPEKDGNGYIDKTAVVGQAYQYQVQAISSTGVESSKSSIAPAALGADSTPVPTITYDTGGNADLEPFLRDVAVPFLKTWYPKVANLIAYPDYTPMGSFTIRLDANLDTLSYAASTNLSNGTISVSPAYVRGHQTDTAFLLREGVHVIQSQATEAGNNTPRWLLDGVADLYSLDYVLHWRDIDTLKPKADSTNYYTDAGAAYFLNWLNNNYDGSYARKITIDGHNNAFAYTDLQIADGRNIDELYAQMIGIPSHTGPFVSRDSKKCIDVAGGSITPRAKVQLYDCNNMIAQKITAWPNKDGTVSLHVLGSCLDIEGAGVANGTQVWLWPCVRNGVAQEWHLLADGSIINPHSGRCLEIAGAGSGGASGTQIWIWDCNGGVWQKWTIPANTPIQ